jgi:adenylate cyclase class 1
MRQNSSLLPAERHFIEYNRRRVNIALQVAPQKSAIALYLAPVLLHFNHPSLPGYIDGAEEASGIAVFELTEQMKSTASSLVKDYSSIERDLNQQSRNMRKPAIESLILMGSVGSCAQNAQSDFDFWVVVDEKTLTPQAQATLRKKLVLVEKWAEKQNTEIHFFYSDVDKVRVGDFGSADKESAGSSQAKLLKEEFYRTCIHVAGKYPIWWLTPPSTTDQEYADSVKKITAATGFDKSRYVDLGNAGNIGIEEVFGAALWQINKAMDSPYKSVMKIALMESLVDKNGDSTLLCDELKKYVLADVQTPKATDPYLLMINRLLNFYVGKKRDGVVSLIRKCFYNKAKVKIIPGIRKKQTRSFKEEAMINCVDDWGWDETTTNHMNDFENWDFESMLKLGNELHAFLLETYKEVTDLLKTGEGTISTITDTDRTVLGRKLFSFYKRQPGKIELIKRPSDDAVRQESVTFYPILQTGKKPVWCAFRGNVATEVARNQNIDYATLKKGQSLAEVIFWLTVNVVIDGKSFLHLIPNQSPVALKTIQGLMKLINEFMPNNSLSYISNEALLKPPMVSKMIFVANLTSHPWKKDLDEVTILFQNTHGENFCEQVDPKNAATRVGELAGNANLGGLTTPYEFFKVFVAPVEEAAKLEKAIRALIISKLKTGDS